MRDDDDEDLPLEEHEGGPVRLDLDDPVINTKWLRAEVPCQKVRHALATGNEARARTLLEELIRDLRGVTEVYHR